MSTERQLREERTELIERSKPIVGKLERGQRLNADERRALNTMHSAILGINQEITQAVEARQLSADGARGMGGAPSINAYGTERFGSDDSTESRAFSNYVRTGAISPELRAAGDATGSAGGFLVPPGWWQRLQIALRAYGGTASDFAPLETETGQPMQWATVDPTNISAVVIAENTQISDQDYTFGQGTLGAYMYTSGVQKVSFQLSHDSAFNIDQFVEARVSESLGRKVAADAISGTGSGQPLGIITALNAASGLSSGGVYTLGTGSKVQTLSSGASASSGTQMVTELIAGTPAPSTFLQIVKSVDRAYRSLGAKWYFNDATLAGARSITDNYGQPYYPSLQSDVSPTLLDYPVVIDQNIPTLTASTASGIIFGHLPSAMVMRTVQGAGLLRLEERYADFLQVGYIGYRRVDMRSNDLRSAVVVKAAAS
jgi:HK97 family phage major capsid protein